MRPLACATVTRQVGCLAAACMVSWGGVACSASGFAVEARIELAGVPVPALLEVQVQAYLDDGVALEDERSVTLAGKPFFARPPDSNRVVVVGTELTGRIDIVVVGTDGTVPIASGSASVPRQPGIVPVVITLGDGGGSDGGPDGGTDAGGSDASGSDASGSDVGVTDVGTPMSTCPMGAEVLVVTVVADDGNDTSATSVTDVGGPGDVSLREALIIAANNSGTAHNIVFDPGLFPPGSYTAIDVGAGTAGDMPLPMVFDETCIDGALGVVLDGSGLSAGDGLHVIGNDNVIAGLFVVNFPDDGIDLDGALNNVIRDTWVGGIPGAQMGNGADGIDLHTSSNGNTIGPVVSIANGGDGIRVSTSDGNTIRASFIGTTPGNLLAGNTGYGIRLVSNSMSNTIGGAMAGDGNVIVLNASGGVGIVNAGGAFNVIEGNRIGTLTSTFAANFGNGGPGVLILDAHDNTVGPDNVIGHNSGPGVEVMNMGAVGNRITENLIALNAMGGIVLLNSGNLGLAPPTLVSSMAGMIAGTHPGGGDGVVEIFNGIGDDDARCWVGSATVTAGSWAFTGATTACGDPLRHHVHRHDEQHQPVLTVRPLRSSRVWVPCSAWSGGTIGAP